MTMTTLKKTAIEQRRCAHCESEIGNVCVEETDTGLCFCCEGCRSVYNLINGEGFSSFYDKRNGWQTGPIERADAAPEYFENCIKNIQGGISELSVIISGIRCAACIWLIENSVSKEKGIKSVRMNYATHKAKIQFDPSIISLHDVLKKITRLGYCPLPYDNEETVQEKERKDYFFRFGTAAFFTMQLMIYSAALYAGYFQGMEENFRILFKIISCFLATPVIFYSGMPFFKNSLKALKNHNFTMDTLVALGSGSAYIYSIAAIFLGEETYFDTSAMILTLILLGRFIEAGAKQKSGNAVKKLMSLKPVRVTILIPETQECVVIPVSQLKKGDLFKVESGLSAAADGVVEKGTADMNESMLTGEPEAVYKQKGAEVFAGTKCLTGSIIVRASAVGQETFLAKIATSVEEAQESKAPIHDVADRFVGKFVPFVLCVALLTFAGWLIVGNNSISESLMKAVSVLVIACPCAMGLATPLAIITALSRLSHEGVIFKNGEAIERLACANDFYFDKTGTITEGQMNVEKIIISGKSEEEKKLIVSAARKSKHPASRAIAAVYDAYYETDTFTDIPARGVDARVNGKSVIIGSFQFMIEKGIDISSFSSAIENGNKWKANGLTVVYAAINGELIGIFGMTDIVRQSAAEAINALIKKGNKVSVLTGDSTDSAARILKNIGIKIPVYAGISPFEKAEIIKSSSHPAKTVMVGDGINDAIALTAAGVGIAMREGTDISIESASAVMLRSDLNIIVKIYEISRKSLIIIKENLFWAFSYNLLAVPLAITGLIHPIISAAFMSISSLFVVLNSLRIKRI